MKDFVLIFRMDITTPGKQPSPEMMQHYMVQWNAWLNEIAANDQLGEGGNHFSPTNARVLRPGNTIANGPYTMHNESVAGYIIVHADDIEDAVRIAQKCPILIGEGTSVEVRETAPRD